MREINKEKQTLSYSGAKELFKSLADYEHYLTKDREDSPAFLIGRAFDTSISEPEIWSQKFAVLPEWPKEPVWPKEKDQNFGDLKEKDNKEYKKQWKENLKKEKEEWKNKSEKYKNDWIEENKGKDFITQDQYDLVKNMYNAVFRHPLASKLLSQSSNTYEKDLKFELAGVPCHGRFDVLNPTKGFFADIKTTVDASIEGCLKAIGNYKYYWQIYFYELAYLANYGQRPKQHCFIFVQKSAPYTVTVIELSQVWLDTAEREIKPVLEKFKLWKAGEKLYEGTHPGIYCADKMPAYLSRKDLPETYKDQALLPEPRKVFVDLRTDFVPNTPPEKEVESPKKEEVKEIPTSLFSGVENEKTPDLYTVDTPDEQIEPAPEKPKITKKKDLPPPPVEKEIPEIEKPVEDRPAIEVEKVEISENHSLPVFEFKTEVCTESQRLRIVTAANKLLPEAIVQTGHKFSFSADFQMLLSNNDFVNPSDWKSKKDAMALIKFLESKIQDKNIPDF